MRHARVCSVVLLGSAGCFPSPIVGGGVFSAEGAADVGVDRGWLARERFVRAAFAIWVAALAAFPALLEFIEA